MVCRMEIVMQYLEEWKGVYFFAIEALYIYTYMCSHVCKIANGPCNGEILLNTHLKCQAEKRH